MSNCPPVVLRLATQEDAERLFRWRKDPITVEMSRSEGQVEWAEHVEWLKGVLDNPASTLWVAEADGEPVGRVRADYGNGTCELSWTTAPEHRREGYGTAIVQAAVDRVRQSGRAMLIVAEIKAENVASKKVAKRAGFEYQEDEGELERWVQST